MGEPTKDKLLPCPFCGSTNIDPEGAAEAALAARPAAEAIDIVFDGPPGPEAGRFVEVENAQGHSIRIGEWIDRKNGYWALRFHPAAGAVGEKEIARAIERAPAALKSLGERLADILDADQWNNIEPLLLELAALLPASPSGEGWRAKLDQIKAVCDDNAGVGRAGKSMAFDFICQIVAPLPSPPTESAPPSPSEGEGSC